MKDLSFYDIVGILAPGTVLTAGIAVMLPDVATFVTNEKFNVGEFGLFLLVAYVAGNLVASFGNIGESIYWLARGGWPSERALGVQGKVLSSHDQQVLEEKLKRMGLIAAGTDLSSFDGSDQKKLIRKLYAHLEQRGISRRVDLFNAQYGMNRGIFAGLVLLGITSLILHGFSPWKIQVTLACLSVLAAFRMERFANYYSTEILYQFLAASEQPGAKQPVPNREDN